MGDTFTKGETLTLKIKYLIILLQLLNNGNHFKDPP